ncbi:oligosaccharide flippase family protein [Lacticaseibacillus paracasei]|uniref:oligosaccharide flippase family protein n=1 Tax=Lacticaseibacillus paracasei TaxID=1597 RepID=UPI002B4BD716|nr:oligosaccharide flippase family protein [Lacticaseibacillus paracasei]WRM21415.1 oligosaccharide flippase family protein [Lacticaseibacillus paracasei]
MLCKHHFSKNGQAFFHIFWVVTLIMQSRILIVPMVTTPYITRVLGSDGVGINAYTNSIIQYFVLFGSIGVTLYGNRTIAFQRDDPIKISQSFWEITFLRFTTIFISFVAFFFF